MKVLGIDPGTEVSAYVLLDGMNVEEKAIIGNERLWGELDASHEQSLVRRASDGVCLEMVASYGMAVGREVFETVAWIGRFESSIRCSFGVWPHRVFRKDVKLHLCQSMRAKDANIRQALLDMFPATGGGKTPQIGTKGAPGPLYGMKSHMWSALAVAVTGAAQLSDPQENRTTSSRGNCGKSALSG